MTNEKKIVEMFVSMHSDFSEIEPYLSVSLYGDILDTRKNEKERVIAISDLPHDLMELGSSDMPKKWTIL